MLVNDNLKLFSFIHSIHLFTLLLIEFIFKFNTIRFCFFGFVHLKQQQLNSMTVVLLFRLLVTKQNKIMNEWNGIYRKILFGFCFPFFFFVFHLFQLLLEHTHTHTNILINLN